jgi:hypothetical protein
VIPPRLPEDFIHKPRSRQRLVEGCIRTRRRPPTRERGANYGSIDLLMRRAPQANGMLAG